MKILGPKQSYAELLDLAQAAKEQPADRFPLRPSAAGYCTRRLGFDLMAYLGRAEYEKPEEAANVQRIFSLGNAVERNSIYAFKDLRELDDKTEVKYLQQAVTLFELPKAGKQPARLVEGSTDLVVYFDGHRGIGDVKSKKDGWSSIAKTKWDESIEKLDGMKSLVRIMPRKTECDAWWANDLTKFLNELNEWDSFFVHNFAQLNSYAMTKFFQERNVDHGFIYRYNKNDSRHLEVRFRPSAKVFKMVERKFNDVWKTIAGGGTPDDLKRDYALGSIVCAFCPYATYCRAEDAKREFFKTLPSRKAYPRPIAEINSGEDIEALVEEVLELEKTEKAIERAQQEACRLLEAAGVSRFRLSTGEIMEVRELKSPRPHYVLRRTK